MEDKNIIFNFARGFLAEKPIKQAGTSAKECNFCHMDRTPDAIADIINKKGYYILEMENSE